MTGQAMEVEDEVVATEVTIEENGVRVDLEYIGEGSCGDYQSDDPKDEPLLRFNVSKQAADGSWEQLDDASYCTNLNAGLPLEVVRAAAQHIMNCIRDDVRAGYSIKRICERLSWIDETIFGTLKHA